MSIDIIGARSHAFRILAVFLAAFLTVGFASAANAADNVTICHYDKTQAVYITITPADQGSDQGHQHHADDLIPAPAGGCPAGLVPVDPIDDGAGDGVVPGDDGAGDGVVPGGDGAGDGVVPGDDGDPVSPGSDNAEDSGGESDKPDKNGAGSPVVHEPRQDNLPGDSVLAEIKGSSVVVGVNRPGAMVQPVAGVLPATGAVDKLGLLTAAGFGLVLIGGLTISTRRRPTSMQR